MKSGHLVRRVINECVFTELFKSLKEWCFGKKIRLIFRLTVSELVSTAPDTCWHSGATG